MKRSLSLSLIFGLLLTCLIAEAARAPSEVASLLQQIQVGEPEIYKNLAVYPLMITKEIRTKSIIPFDEAMDQKLLSVRELDEAQVNTVVADNKSDQPIFMMRGEVLSRAKQDRMSATDVLIPPHAKNFKIPVFCTEHGRWQGSSNEFGTAKFNALPSLRQNALVYKDQSQVWAGVEDTAESLKVDPSPSRALQSVVVAPEVKTNIKRYQNALSNFASSNTKRVGVVAVIPKSKILIVDLFSSHELFTQYWPKLLDSYSIEAYRCNGKLTPLTTAKIEQFLRDARRENWSQVKTVGEGKLLELKGYQKSGSALITSGSVVHMDLSAIETMHRIQSISPNRYHFNRTPRSQNRSQTEPRIYLLE